MTNLLPPEELQNVRRFYRARFLTAGSLVATACAAVACIALAPSFFMLWFDASSQSASPVTASNNELDQAEYMATQDLLKQLAPAPHATSSPIDTVMRAVSARPAGILINSVNYVAGKLGPSIVVIGTSQKREAINTYYNVLKNDNSFKSVVIPVEDLVGTNGSTFTITLTGT